MRVAVAVNPTAGRGRGRRAGRAGVSALQAAGHEVVDVSGDSYGAAARGARRVVADGRVDALVVVGGDGMVHLGFNAVAGSPVALGVLAAGTGNDFARAAGLPVGDVSAGVDRVVAGLRREPGRVDAGVAVTADGRSVFFAGVLSAGLDAAVNAHANRVSWPSGRARYVRSALREITRFRPYGYRVSVWGPVPVGQVAGVAVTAEREGSWVWRSPGTVVAVANSGWIGGGIHVAPDASVTDGLFDVVVAGSFSRVGAARIFPSMYGGGHVNHPRVGVVRASRVVIEASGEGRPPPVAFADGERIGAVPVEVGMAAGAIRVVGVENAGPGGVVAP